MKAKLNPDQMTFLEHLEDLRWKLIYSVITLFFTTALALWQSDWIIEFLKYPITRMDQVPRIIYLKPTGMISIRINTGLVAGIILGLPVIFYQMWGFIAPGLYKREKKLIVALTLATLICFLCGFFFAYFIILPIGLQFLLSIGVEGIDPQLDIGEYIGFVLQMVLIFGIVFELPIVVYTLNRLGILHIGILKKIRPYAIVTIFIISAILTPPDVVSQILMAIPLILLYELSILLVRIIGKKKS